MGSEMCIRDRILAATETYPHIPVVMHQDHGNAPDTCYSAAINGFTSVMMDGSLEADAKTPASYDYNVNVTKQVVDFAHSVGVSVEGELGCLGFQGTVHHHGGEAVGSSTEAGGRAVAVVLVHHHGDVRIGLNSGQDQVAQEVLTGVGACLLYTSPSPRDLSTSRMPSSA